MLQRYHLKRLVLGLLLYISALRVAPCLSSKGVSLFNPYITKITFNACTYVQKDDYTICNLTLSTRGADYKLLNFGPGGSKYGNLTTDGTAIKRPNLEDSSGFMRGTNLISYKEYEKDLSNMIEGKKFAEKGAFYYPRDKAQEWRVLEASTTVKLNGQTISIFTKDGYTGLCKPKLACRRILIGDLMHNESEFLEEHKRLPLVALGASPYPDNHPRKDNSFLLLAADQAGMMSLFEVILPDNDKTMYTPIKLADIDLSEIVNQYNEGGVSVSSGKPPMTLLVQLASAGHTDWRQAGAYVQAITAPEEVYPDYNRTEKATNNVTNYTDVPLCLFNGLQNKGPTDLYCKHHGKDLTQSIMQFVNAGGAGFIASIGALHIANYRGLRHVHIAYRLKQTGTTTPENRYLFCRYEPQRPKQISLSVSVSNEECLPTKIINLPSDILGFDDGRQCSRTIALYDSLYTIHQVSDPIIDTRAPMGVLAGINFHINAAMNIKDTFYFFTHSNDLAIFKAKMTDNCMKLELDLNSFARSLSEEFVLPRTSSKTLEHMTPPFMLDYRQFIEGANDTDPPFLSSLADVTTSDKPTNSTTGRGSSSSSIVIIAVGVIFGGLIVATIIYCFCFQDSNGDQQERMLTRKQTKSVRKIRSPAEKVSEMDTKTVRSAVQSNIQPASKTPQPPAQATEASANKSVAKSSRVISLKKPAAEASSKSSPAAKQLVKSKSKSNKSPKSPKSPKSSKSKSKSSAIKGASPSQPTRKSQMSQSPKSRSSSPKSSSASPKSPASNPGLKSVASKAASKASKGSN